MQDLILTLYIKSVYIKLFIFMYFLLAGSFLGNFYFQSSIVELDLSLVDGLFCKITTFVLFIKLRKIVGCCLSSLFLANFCQVIFFFSIYISYSKAFWVYLMLMHLICFCILNLICSANLSNCFLI